MASIHPSIADTAPAQRETVREDGEQTVMCPFCQTAHAYDSLPDCDFTAIACPSCAQNLIVLNPESKGTDETTADSSSLLVTSLPDLSQRVTGIAVGVLACLLNYTLLLGATYWAVAQIKTTHDPYNVDELTLSPFILRSNGWTDLHLAAARGESAEVSELLTDKAPVDQRHGAGRTALYEASKRGHTTVVALLLHHGANPNTKDKEGHTPLLAAAEQGHSDTTALLLSHGADLNATCSYGDSALHLAVRQGHVATAHTLLEHGISVNAKARGQTPLEMALPDQNEALIQLLQSHGGKEFSQARAKREQGKSFQGSGHIDNALFAYAEAISLDPNDALAYYDRGTALMLKDDADNALIAFQAAIALDPSFLEAYRGAARVFSLHQQWRQAVALWDRYLLHQPQSSLAHFERAVIKRAEGDTEGFLQDLHRACALGHQPAC